MNQQIYGFLIYIRLNIKTIKIFLDSGQFTIDYINSQNFVIVWFWIYFDYKMCGFIIFIVGYCLICFVISLLF